MAGEEKLKIAIRKHNSLYVLVHTYCVRHLIMNGWEISKCFQINQIDIFHHLVAHIIEDFYYLLLK